MSIATRFPARALAAATTATALALAAVPAAHAEERVPRPFIATGDPVAGSTEEAGAPVLTPGLHKDLLKADKQKRYYRIKRSPGSRIWVTFTYAEPTDQGGTAVATLTTPGGGTDCNGGEEEGESSANTRGIPQSLVLAAKAIDPVATSPDRGECLSAPELIAGVQRDVGGDTPVEILVMEQPAATDAAALPTSTSWSSSSSYTVTASGDAREVRGSGGFADAPVITPGVTKDKLWPGEYAIYKFRLDYGQQAAVTTELPAAGEPYSPGESGYSLQGTLALVGPARGNLGHTSISASNYDKGPAKDTLQMGPVTFRNQFGYSSDVPTVAGWFYVSVGLARASDAATNQLQVPMKIHLEVKGNPTGRPQFKAPDPAQMTNAPAASDAQLGRSTVGLPWIVTGTLGTLLLLGGIGWWLLSRRRRA